MPVCGMQAFSPSPPSLPRKKVPLARGVMMLFHQEKNTFPKSLLSLPRREDPDLAPNTSGWKCSWGALRLTYQHPDEGTAFSPVAIWF